MSLFKQSAFLAAAKFLDKAASMVLVLIVSRQLGEEGLGEFFYFFALGGLFLPLIDMGFGFLLLQRWHERDDLGRRVLMTQLLYLKFGLGLTALGGMLIGDALNHPGHSNALAVTVTFLALYFDSFCDFLRRPAHARGVIWIEAVFPLAARAVQLGGLFFFMNRITSGFEVIFLFAASSLLEMFISFYGLLGCSPVNLAGKKLDSWYQMLVDGFPFAMSGFFIMAMMNFDSVILGHYSMRDVGAYNAAMRVILVLNVLNGAILHALFPKLIAARAANDAGHAGWLVNGTLRVFLIIFGAIALGGACVGDGLMQVLYPKSFTETGTVFRLLSPLILLTAIYSLLGQTLELLGEQRKVMCAYALTAALSIAGNLILIPYYGMYGSVAATLVSTGVMVVILTVMLRRNKSIVFNFDGVGRAVLFLVVVTAFYLPLALINVWAAIPLGALIFAALLFPIRGYWFCGMGRMSGGSAAEASPPLA